MTKTVFRIHTGRSQGTIEVSEGMLERAGTSTVWYKGRYTPLCELVGDVVIKTDNITLVQISWLLANQEIAYLFVDKKRNELNLGIRPPNSQPERGSDNEAYKVA
jgi:hypothetical protein